MPKDFHEFLEYVRSPQGGEDALEGVLELFDPNHIAPFDFRRTDEITRYSMQFFRACEQNAINLLRMYHDWLSNSP